MDDDTAPPDGGIRTLVNSGIGIIELDRPKALNALTTSMVTAIGDTLDVWEKEQPRTILLQSAISKVFCAGGDIRAIRENSLSDNPAASAASERFFSAEYRLNYRIANFGIPIVSLIDGICMGGGIGLSIHGRFRLVTEKSRLSMPETEIGFFPDIGASYFLPRLPGALGLFLGLTGYRLDAADALYTGLATHFIASDRLKELQLLLAQDQGRRVEDVLQRMDERIFAGESQLAKQRSAIDSCFSARSLPEIRSRLAAIDDDWSRSTLEVLSRMSPQSLEITFALFHWGKENSLKDCLTAELQLARTVITTTDFVEGIRAALVDKDRKPNWGSSQFMGLSRLGNSRWRTT